MLVIGVQFNRWTGAWPLQSSGGPSQSWWDKSAGCGANAKLGSRFSSKQPLSSFRLPLVGQVEFLHLAWIWASRHLIRADGFQLIHKDGSVLHFSVLFKLKPGWMQLPLFSKNSECKALGREDNQEWTNLKSRSGSHLQALLHSTSSL